MIQFIVVSSFFLQDYISFGQLDLVCTGVKPNLDLQIHKPNSES